VKKVNKVPDVRVLIIPRDFVENMNLEWTLNGLRFAVANPTPEWVFSLDGYDGEPELWEIPSVRAFIAALDEQFDLWLSILKPGIGAYSIILKCLIDDNSIGCADIVRRHLLATITADPSRNTIIRALKCAGSSTSIPECDVLEMLGAT
jgi:hypothetical protein